MVMRLERCPKAKAPEPEPEPESLVIIEGFDPPDFFFLDAGNSSAFCKLMDDVQNNFEVEPGRPNQDGQIAAETLTIAVTGPIEHLGQYQPTHDQDTQLDEMKKRRRTVLNDEEKQERKKNSDKKYRAKAKTSHENTEGENKALKSEVERLQSEVERFKSEKDSYAQELQDVTTQIEKLQNDKEELETQVKDIESQFQAANIKRERCEAKLELLTVNAQQLLDAATENGKLQCENNILKDRVGKLEKRLRVHKAINASRMKGKVDDLQIGAINTLGPQYSKGLQQENERLGFEEDGGGIIGRLVSQIQPIEMSSQQPNAEEARTDCAEAAKHLSKVRTELSM